MGFSTNVNLNQFAFAFALTISMGLRSHQEGAAAGLNKKVFFKLRKNLVFFKLRKNHFSLF